MFNHSNLLSVGMPVYHYHFLVKIDRIMILTKKVTISATSSSFACDNTVRRGVLGVTAPTK